MVEDDGLPPQEDQPVEKSVPAETEVGDYVVGIKMEGGGARLSHLDSSLADGVLQEKRLFEVDDIRPGDCFHDRFPVHLRVAEAVGAYDRLEQRKLEMTKGKIRLRAGGIRVADSHEAGVNSVDAQVLYRVEC